MTKRHHTCPFCRQPEHVTTGTQGTLEGFAAFIDKTGSQGWLGAFTGFVERMEQAARQRREAFERLLAVKRQPMRSQAELEQQARLDQAEGGTLGELAAQVVKMLDPQTAACWAPCLDCCEEYVCAIHDGHASDCACDPVGEPEGVWERLGIDPYAPGSLAAYRAAHVPFSDQTDLLLMPDEDRPRFDEAGFVE